MRQLSALSALALSALAAASACGLLGGAVQAQNTSRERELMFSALETVAEVAAKIQKACPARFEAALQSMIEGMNSAPERAGRQRASVPAGSGVMKYLEAYAELVASTPKMPPRRVMWVGADALARAVDDHSRFLSLGLLRKSGSPSPGLFLDRDTDGIMVRHVDPASPSDAAGVRTGDHVISVDGQATALMPLDDVQELLFGNEQTTVKLAVERSGQFLEFSLARTASVKAVTADLRGDVLVITVPGFSEGVAKLVETLIETARSKKLDVRGYVIDLRQNTGGLVEEVAGLADVFMDEGVIMSQARVRGCAKTDFIEDTRRASTGDAARGAPVVLLIGADTASGAEMFASAMMESGRARSIGQQTNGSGRIQTLIGLKPETGAALKVSTSEFLTATGHYIDGVGVAPTIEISPEEDALARAVAMIADR